MPRIVELNGVVANCLAAGQLHLGGEALARNLKTMWPKAETVMPTILWV